MIEQPLYRSIPIPEQMAPANPPSTDVDLTTARPAASVADANNKFYARAAAAVYHAANVALPSGAAGQNNYEDYGVTILAKWAYKDYFSGPEGDTHRSDTIPSILQQQAGTTGTDGDYDVLLNLLYIPLIYKYYNDLPANVANHVINNLLTVRGPLSQHESEYETVATVNIPETENHLFMIETARYLTNQLLYQRTHSSDFDNRRNGNGNDPQATLVWIRHALQAVLQSDFVEYNARDYQDFVMMSLLNLYSYAYDGDVRLAARMVLDYISAKVAVSSNGLRRAAPFRRLNQDAHWGPAIPGGFFLRSPLLKPYAGYATYEPDPQGAWYAMLAGNTGLLGDHAPGLGPGNFALAMVVAGVHDYRVPDPILDLFVNHRRTYQRFHHEHNIRNSGARDIVDELYAGSLSYLITAGGHPTGHCYEAGPFNGGHTADLGSAMPTTFMPTNVGVPTDADLTLDHMIQFGPYTDQVTDNDHVKSHMGVAPDFACGSLIYLPDEFDPSKNPHDTRLAQEGKWTFIDRGSDGSSAGYYLAIYREQTNEYGLCGILEAYDTWLHAGRPNPLSFAEFQQAVKANNSTLDLKFGGPLGLDPVNTYITCSGQKIGFTIAPVSDIVSTTDEPEPAGYKDKFTHGTILNSLQGSGLIVVSNPYVGAQITLDMRDVRYPVRTSESGRVERAGPDSHQEVWVDFDSPANVPEEGDFYHPVRSLAAAQSLVAVGGTIRIMPGSTNERIRISKRMTIQAVAGLVAIG